jgi:hypothetical protein
MLLRVIAVVALLFLPLGTATAQETSDADVPVVSLTRLSAESAVASPIAMPPAAAAALTSRPRQGDEKETHRWDAIKTGFYAGLIVGGIVGVALVAECGHPECGPMLTIAAGVGGAIGMAIDALVDRRMPVEGVSAHGRSRALRDNRKVGISFRTSW